VSSKCWIDTFVDQVSQYTDAPEVVLRTSAYFTASAALKKNAYSRTFEDTYTNLFFLIVAPPERFRKSTAAKIGMKIARTSIPERHIMPQGGSDVAFDDALSEAGGFGVAYYEEFAEFVNVSASDVGNQLNNKLIRYFNADEGSYKHRTRKDGVVRLPEKTVLTFFSTCTDDSFVDFMSEDKIKSGLFSRFVIISPTDEDLREEMEIQPEVPPMFYPKMKDSLRRLVPRERTKIGFTEEAQKIYAAYHKGLREYCDRMSNPGFTRSVTRAHEILKRLSIIRAVTSGRLCVNEKDIHEAYDGIIDPYLGSVEHLLTLSDQGRPDQKLRAKLYHYLLKTPCTPRILARNFNERTESIHKELRELINMGQVYSVTTGKMRVFHALNGQENLTKEDVVRELKELDRYRAKQSRSYGHREQ
jgi:hypothetical protein